MFRPEGKTKAGKVKLRKGAALKIMFTVKDVVHVDEIKQIFTHYILKVRSNYVVKN